MTLLEIIAGIILILAGLGWMVLAFFGSMMAARQIDVWKEQIKPMLFGLIPVALGIAIIVWS